VASTGARNGIGKEAASFKRGKNGRRSQIGEATQNRGKGKVGNKGIGRGSAESDGSLRKRARKKLPH